MPHIVIHLSGQPDARTSRRVVDKIMALTQSVLGKPPGVTSIALTYVAPETWFIAGRPLSETGHRAFYLDIRVTDETNTRQEKARYIAAVYAAFEELPGKLHECSYIHVIDARAAAYGYGGATQEYRHQRAER